VYKASDISGKAGAFWTNVFLQQEFVQATSVTLSVCLNDLRRYADGILRSSSRTKIPAVVSDSLQVFILEEGQMTAYADAYGDGGVYGGGSLYAGTPDTWSFPFSGTSPTYLTTSLSPGSLLRNGKDFHVAGGKLTLYMHPALMDGIYSEVYEVRGGVPLMRWTLYGINTLEMFSMVQELYSEVAEVYGKSSPYTMNAATNIAWDLRVTGATEWNMSRALYLAGGCRMPSRISGEQTVRRISAEGDANVVYTEDLVFSAPMKYSVLVEEGEAVTEGTRIFDVFRLTTGCPSEADVPAFLISRGIMSGLQSGVIIRNTHLPVVNRRWQVDGSPMDVETYFRTLDEQGFYSYLEDRYGRVPETLNPVAELAELIRYSSVFLSMPPASGPEGRAVLEVFQKVYPAGSTVFIYAETEIAAETLSPVLQETAEVFQAVLAQEPLSGVLSDASLITST